MFDLVYRGKKVLVTGHTGFKGSWLANWLVRLGADVYGLSAYVPSVPSLYKESNVSNYINEYDVNVCDYEALYSTVKSISPDIVFHLAAQSIVKLGYRNPRLTFETNLCGTVNIMEATRHVDSISAIVLVTSDKCYENVEWEYGYRETDRLGGKDPYSASKAAAEIAIHAYFESYIKDSHVKLASVRAGNVIGGGDWADDRIVPDSMRAWSTGKNVEIRAPKATRPWQHVLEPLSGYLWLGSNLLANEYPGLNGESFNFGPDPSSTYSVEELLIGLSQYWEGVGCEVLQNPNDVKEAGLLKLSCDKALQYLSWRPTLDFDQTLRFTSEWYRRYYDGEYAQRLVDDNISEYTELAKHKDMVWTQNENASAELLEFI